MAIYHMSGSTFKKIFLKENPNKVLKSTFIIVSSRIRTTGKYDNNVINLSQLLYPDARVLSDMSDLLNDNYFREIYYKQLNEHKLLLARIVKQSVLTNNTIILLSSDLEYENGYIQMLADYIEEKFDYPVYNYKKIKTGKEKARPFGKNHVLYKCEKIIEKAIKKKHKELLKSKSGRKKILDNMSKEEMISQMKKLQLYISGMEKDEMYDILEVYFVNG